MSAAEKLKISPGDYLASERTAVCKSEYVAGDVFSMAGASYRHNLIAANLLSEIHSQFRDRPCTVLGSDMKIWMADASAFAYPDLSGLCCKPDFVDEAEDAYANPSFVIEVLSDSTETYDRGDKFHRYQSLPSLVDYILVSQTGISVEMFRRHEAGWLYQSMRSLADSLALTSVAVTVPLRDIYRGVFA